MSRSARNLPEYWDTYKPHRGDGEPPAPEADGFEWTQHPGHGPGEEFLGWPRTALELGSAESKEAVFLARKGIEVTALDFSASQAERARTWWNGTDRLAFVHAEACEYLAATETTYDAIYSVWGAVWFTDPDDLIPLVVKSLNPGGVFAFSQAEPIEGHYGAQAMYGNGLSGRKLTVLRWNYAPETWADILKRNGFTQVDAHVLEAPDPADVGTLMVRAQAPE
ncbi:bifunctional 2-polyprenyl-6-hydroxyphenol methylase/3-demethylubiquinol 3-O-methyltransferase UbiG [Streptomyces sp. XD-27]|uniref:class I SAM-dependent methyltransferase n=1 Tax=Streptomyces sp. XD-27 TaxID=3062779 RepID=UPI0026F46EC3|nr:methyltransferase domain-containing protein [Streptomyces sp. XD-27]WKX72116.1 methyltransferase domain-containing protein [Streptomyces sp. XD-27]